MPPLPHPDQARECRYVPGHVGGEETDSVKGGGIQAAGDTRQDVGEAPIKVLAAIVSALDQHSAKPPSMANALLPVLEMPEQGRFRVLWPHAGSRDGC
jgi:hypothetical protein